jgi:translation initiation factor IF-3
VTIMFRGREQSRPELGFRLLRKLSEEVAELGFVEASPKQDGRNMIMVLAPHRATKVAATDAKVATAEAKATASAEAKTAAAAAKAEHRAAPNGAAPAAPEAETVNAAAGADGAGEQ